MPSVRKPQWAAKVASWTVDMPERRVIDVDHGGFLTNSITAQHSKHVDFSDAFVTGSTWRFERLGRNIEKERTYLSHSKLLHVIRDGDSWRFASFLLDTLDHRHDRPVENVFLKNIQIINQDFITTLLPNLNEKLNSICEEILSLSYRSSLCPINGLFPAKLGKFKWSLINMMSPTLNSLFKPPAALKWYFIQTADQSPNKPSDNQRVRAKHAHHSHGKSALEHD